MKELKIICVHQTSRRRTFHIYYKGLFEFKFHASGNTIALPMKMIPLSIVNHLVRLASNGTLDTMPVKKHVKLFDDALKQNGAINVSL